MSKFVLGIAALIIFLISVTIPTALCAKPDTISQNKIITEVDNGNTIHIKEGHTFYLKLKENPSTGYSWQFSLSSGLNKLSDKYYPPETSKKEGRFVIGSAGYRLWEIKATGKGNQQVNVIYKRSWETETGNEQIFKLNIVVV